MKTIVTHNAKFHTDDAFAVATLFILLGKENCKVVRTRDEALIATGDYVVDVGNVYDEANNKFDHHQYGGAGTRPNGVPYASFGLVWKKFGKQVCDSQSVADVVDQNLVQSVDAADNGFDTIKTLIPNVYPYDINNLVNLYRFTWKEEGEWDSKFLECVDWAQTVLERLIKISTDAEEGRKIVMDAYNSSSDKKIIEVDKKYDLGRELVMSVLVTLPEPIYAVLYRADVNNWQVLAIRKAEGSFDSRKPFPESWRAKRDEDLDKVTGLSGTVFCHKNGFMCVVKSNETALALAKKALEA